MLVLLIPSKVSLCLYQPMFPFSLLSLFSLGLGNILESIIRKKICNVFIFIELNQTSHLLWRNCFWTHAHR